MPVQRQEFASAAGAISAGSGGSAGAARSDLPLLVLVLRPNRPLTPAGGGWVLGLVAFGLSVPLLMLRGTSASWGLLPFLLAALAGLYFALHRNHLDGRLTEELRLWPDLITVEHWEARGKHVKHWHANPYWVQAHLHRDATIESYLTLSGNGREIELGAFLSPEEREALHDELVVTLDRLRVG